MITDSSRTPFPVPAQGAPSDSERQRAPSPATTADRTPKRLLLKLALRACERGDTQAAAEAIRGVLALPASERAPTPPSRRAVALAKFAAMIGYSTRYVRMLLARGILPSDAVIGSGRAKRVLVERALEALRGRRAHHEQPPDSVQAAGAAFVRRRGRLRVVRGGNAGEPTGED